VAKAPSAEIGNKRWYHEYRDGWLCNCDIAKPNPKCSNTYPSVTTILKAWPKEWLGAWAAKITAQTALDELDNLAAMLSREGRESVERYLKGAPWRKRDTARDRGTAAHAAAEQGTAIEDVPENARSRVLAWHAWLDDWQPAIEAQEVTVYQPNGPHRYAGTLDIFALIPCVVHDRDCRWLIDIKTGDLYVEARMQQAAYRFADHTADGQPVPDIDHVGILVLRDDGYAFHEIRAGLAEYAAFLCCAEMAANVARMEAEPRGVLLERP
jgi:hypothetical protein